VDAVPDSETQTKTSFTFILVQFLLLTPQSQANCQLKSDAELKPTTTSDYDDKTVPAFLYSTHNSKQHC
jgi:hypothetical protein